MAQIPVPNVFGGPLSVGQPSAYIAEYTYATSGSGGTGSVAADANGTENVIITNTYVSGGSLTYLLPAESLCAGQIRRLFYKTTNTASTGIDVKNSTGTSTKATILQNAGTGAAAAGKYVGVTLACDGTNWYVIGYTNKPN